MIGRLSQVDDVRTAARTAMADALATFYVTGPVVVLSHFDADGLAASAILRRALRQAGQVVEPLVIGKTESPWDAAVADRIGALSPAGLIVADLGTCPAPVLLGCPTLVIDHHVPTGEPQGAVTISGNGLAPEPTTALLAWWAVGALGDQSDLLWLAAVGLIGDMADGLGFPELDEAQARWGKTALRDATSLINAPRRTAAADAGPALRLLLDADGPKRITKGKDADALALHAAKAEVRVWPIEEFTYLQPSRWNGTLATDRAPHLVRYWGEADPAYCDGKGAESFGTLLRRAEAALERLAALPSPSPIYVFSHGQFIQAVRAVVTESDLDDRGKMLSFWRKGEPPAIGNTELVEFEW